MKRNVTRFCGLIFAIFIFLSGPYHSDRILKLCAGKSGSQFQCRSFGDFQRDVGRLGAYPEIFHPSSCGNV